MTGDNWYNHGVWLIIKTLSGFRGTLVPSFRSCFVPRAVRYVSALCFPDRFLYPKTLYCQREQTFTKTFHIRNMGLHPLVQNPIIWIWFPNCQTTIMKYVIHVFAGSGKFQLGFVLVIGLNNWLKVQTAHHMINHMIIHRWDIFGSILDDRLKESLWNNFLI